jgi:hypothetical protein
MHFTQRFLGIILVSLMATIPSLAQVVGGMNFKLEKLFMDEKYEDVAYKGENMLENDKYKRDPEICLYISMAWYEISQMNDDEMKEEYPKALQDALKYAYKFARYDKEGVWAEDNSDYLDDLAKAGIADAAQWVDDDRKRRNAVRIYKYMAQAMPNDPNVLFFKGVLENMNRNEGQAERDIQEAMKMLLEQSQKERWKPRKATKSVLEDGMIKWADILIEKSYADSAKKTIEWGIQFMPDSEKIAAKGRELGAQ